jgi:hypothetical protein
MLGSSSPPDAKMLAAANRIMRFEVMVYYENHWVIESIMEHEAAAIGLARSLLVDEKNEQVKVVQHRSMPSGFTTTKIIFEQVRPPKPKKEIGLSATIKDAKPCATLEEFFGLDSRNVIGRLLRDFLDSLVITPTELLHNYGYMKKLDNMGNLVNSGVHHIAKGQADGGKGTVKERTEAIHKLIRETMSLARDTMAERKRRLLLEPGGFAQLCRRAEARFEPHEQRYMILTTLCHYLAGSRSYGQKLELLDGLVTPDVEGEPLAMLDGVIADLLGSGQMIQEILGNQANLAAALGTLLDLLGRKLADDPPQASVCMTAINRMLKQRDLPHCRAVLLERFMREISSTKPLSRDPAAERAHLQALVDRFKDEAGKFTGSAELGRALDTRREAIRKAALRKVGIDN